jgi:hypothetical protein
MDKGAVANPGDAAPVSEQLAVNADSAQSAKTTPYAPLKRRPNFAKPNHDWRNMRV